MQFAMLKLYDTWYQDWTSVKSLGGGKINDNMHVHVPLTVANVIGRNFQSCKFNCVGTKNKFVLIEYDSIFTTQMEPLSCLMALLEGVCL